MGRVLGPFGLLAEDAAHSVSWSHGNPLILGFFGICGSSDLLGSCRIPDFSGFLSFFRLSQARRRVVWHACVCFSVSLVMPFKTRTCFLLLTTPTPASVSASL
jgi:hypothetical protein